MHVWHQLLSAWAGWQGWWQLGHWTICYWGLVVPWLGAGQLGWLVRGVVRVGAAAVLPIPAPLTVVVVGLGVAMSMRSWNQWPQDRLPDVVLEFVEWMVTPRWERPKEWGSQAAWARAHGVAAETVSQWKRHPRVKKAVQERCDELNLSPERIQDVMNAVYDAATKGDMKAATLFLQHADKLAPQRTVIEDRRVSTLSDEELRAELAAVGLLAEQSD